MHINSYTSDIYLLFYFFYFCLNSILTQDTELREIKKLHIQLLLKTSHIQAKYKETIINYIDVLDEFYRLILF